MELLQLRYFLESADRGSFAKTAEKYQVPAASVSAAVKRLEKELGCTLFDRSANRIVLNPNGKRMQGTLKRVFAELEQAAEAVSGRESREIKVLIRAGRWWAINRIIAYQKAHPDTRIRTVFHYERDNAEDYDLILDSCNGMYVGYHEQPVYSRPICFKVSKASPLVGRTLTVADLRDEAFVTLHENGFSHRTLCDVCRKAGFEPNFVAAINDMECFARFISEGLAIGLGGRPTPTSNLAALNVTDFEVTQVVCVYYKDTTLAPAARELMEFLKG